ncbi:helix-turn-helix domain-containing protein [Streptomyces sp. NPDC001719]
MDERVGRRIRWWRERRRLTQVEFAALMGQSRRWVQDVERGVRQADPRLSVVERAAQVLQVPLEWLVSETAPGAAAGCTDAAEIAAIRTVVQGYDVITGTAAGTDTPAPAAVLRRRFAHARTAFQAGQFAMLGRLVPHLVVETNRAAALHAQDDDRREALRVLSLLFGLVEGLAVKHGAVDLALTAAHRAVTAAQAAEDPVMVASAARHLADAMTHHGQAAAGGRLAVQAAARLEGELRAGGADGVSVLGMLYLRAAMASATVGRGDGQDAASAAAAVPDLLDAAAGCAAVLGRDDNRMWTAFGPTNVQLHEVAAHVALGEGAAAVAAAEDIRRDALAGLPRERRAHLYTDLAAGRTQAGRRAAAVDALLAAENEAPEEVRCRPRTRQLVEDLRLLGAGPAEGRLRALAGRCGLPG